MVEEIEKEDIAGTSKNTPEFSFVPFSRLDNYIDTFDQVDIIALAIDVQPIRCIQTSFGTGSIPEVTIVNEEQNENKLYLESTLVEKECLTSSQASTIPINQPIVLISTL
ncbi:hypothetical protein Q3G72_033530 [Acer saccharum]|nr:hypothetical protein Q3G72_016125 [Acer saccharum]KAK1589394.1 hypothetical protein Q3G72_033530 [Acer saccharum]